MTAMKNKKIQLLIVIIITAIIALAGAFAWNSFMQQRINTFKHLVRPGVNLHDDFEEGPNKDVYVENSGQTRVFVRVRLTEYLETAARGSLINGHVRDDETAKLGWFPHNGIANEYDCEIQDPFERGELWGSEDFHDYYDWTMGGQKWYMPALIQLGEDEEGNQKALADNPEVCSDLTEYDGTEENVRQTLYASVITMNQWFNGGYTYWDGTQSIQVAAGEKAQGNFWVVDTDGWCYWAQGLEPDEATGLLLDEVKRTEKQFDSNAEYCINVWLQAADEIDVGLFELEQNGGVTESGKLLMRLVSGNIIIGEDGYYENNRDGSFTQVTDAGGTIAENAQRAFIPLVNEVAGGSLNDKVNATEKLYIGETYQITHLVWIGDDYENYGDFDNINVPYYNIGDAQDAVTIKLIGSEIGVDGNVYLRVEQDGQMLYLSSTLRIDTTAQQTVQPTEAEINPMSEEGGEPEDGEPPVTPESEPEPEAHVPPPQFEQYVQSYPGTGPFAVMYSGGDRIGTRKDTRYDTATFKERLFYHIGGGVYVEVDNKTDTTSKDSPVKYYFATSILEPNPLYNKLSTFRGMPADQIDDEVAVTFPLQLTVGDGFDVEFGVDGDGNPYIKIIDPNGDAYTMGEIVTENGTVKIPLGDDGFISADENGSIAGSIGESGGVLFQLPEPRKDGDTYYIRSRADMDWVTIQVRGGSNTFEGKTLKVERDPAIDPADWDGFDMGETTFVPIGINTKQFLGTFDGDDKTITGLVVSGDADYRGLFGSVGTGSTIKNVKLDDIDVSGKAHVGGVAGASAGTIENCHVLGGTVTGTGNNVGGIVGYGHNITDCSNSATVTGTGVSYVGGVVGYLKNTVKNSHNTGGVSGAGTFVGGVVGLGDTGSTIERCYHNSDTEVYGALGEVGGVVGKIYGVVLNCYAWGDVRSGGGNAGGVLGSNSWGYNGHIDNVYHARGTVTGNSNVGGVIGTKGASGRFNYCVALSDAIVGNTASNVNKVAGSASLSGYSLSTMPVTNQNGGTPGTPVDIGDAQNLAWWAGVVGGGFADPTIWTWDDEKNLPVFGSYDYQPEDGAGTQASPWKITSREDMDWLSYQTAKSADGLAGQYFEVGKAFSMGDKPFYPIGISTAAKQFKGTFDGKDYTISGLVVKGDADYRGLFGYIGTGGTIKNVKLDNINVSGKGYVGGVVGASAGTIENCHVLGGTVTATGNISGGVAGNVSGMVKGSSNAASVTGASNVGGLAGYIEPSSVLQDSYNTGKVTGIDSVGGVAGGGGGATISRCYHNNTSDEPSVLASVGSAAGIMAVPTGTRIENCYVWGSVRGAGANVGGIVGYAGSSTPVINVYHAKGTVSGNYRVGGLAAHLYTASITNGVAVSSSISGDVASGVNKVMGYNGGSSTLANCYSWDQMPVVNQNGGNSGGAATWEDLHSWAWWAGVAGGGFADGTIWTWDSENNLPVLGNYEHTLSGAGTEQSPWMITSRADMDWLSYQAGVSANGLTGKYFQVGQDFDMGEEPFYPIGILVASGTDILASSKPFKGTFDGNGKTISGLVVKGDVDGRGLFGYVGTGGTVKNVKLDNINVSGKTYVGGVVGCLNGGTISNCDVLGGSVTASAGNLGGIAGRSDYGTVKNCSNAAEIILKGTYTVGGVVGWNYTGATVENCKNTGKVTVASASNYAGGIVGSNAAVVKNCYSTGDVAGDIYVGGVVGYNTGTITGVYHAKGAVSGSTGVGGVVGYFGSGSMTNVVALAKSVSGTNNVNKVGGTGYSGVNGYAWSDMTLTGATNGWPGIPVPEEDTQDLAWWAGTVGGDFAVGTIWTWDSENNLPVFGVYEHILSGWGTEASPWRIKSRADMDWLSYQTGISADGLTGKYFEVANDFDMGTKPFYPVGNYTKQFKGTFDGNDKTISGLVVKGDTDYRGLFGHLGAGGTIKNVKLDDVEISGKMYVGGFAGGNNGTIENCHVREGTVVGSGMYVGGIAGYNFNLTASGKINNSSNSADITGGDGTGGIVGTNLHSGCAVTRSYNTGNVKGNVNASYIGGISGGNNGGGIIENCYSIGNVEGSGLYTGGVSGNNNGTINGVYHAVGTVKGNTSVGGIVGYNNGAVQNAVAISASITGTSGSSANKAVGTHGGGTYTKVYTWGDMNVLNSSGQTLIPSGGTAGTAATTGDISSWPWWIGTVTGGFANMDIWTWDSGAKLPVLGQSTDAVAGTGTAQDPWMITNRSDMDWMSAMAAVSADGLAGKYFELANDIDMGGTVFYPIGGLSKPFNGTLDGDGKTISDLVVVGDTDYRGLFGYIGANGTVKDLTLDNVSVAGKIYVGGVAGVNFGLISGCVVNAEPPFEPAGGANISGSGMHVGGIAGRNDGDITYCHSNIGKITGSAGRTGGIAGTSQYKVIANCTNSSNVEMITAGNDLGGIVGWNQGGSISDCVNTGTINNTVGRNNGGIVGGMNAGASVTNCRNEGDVTAPSAGGYRTGGIAGVLQTADCSVVNSVNTGNVTASSYEVGGIAGFVQIAGALVKDCVNMGDVSGTDSIGGVAGHNIGTVQASYNTGSVSGRSLVGGVVGQNKDTVTQCYAELSEGKSVSGSANSVGGVIGYNSSTKVVTDCYMWGDVLANSDSSDNVGGVIGFNQTGNVSNIYHAKGDVKGYSFVGGAVGRRDGGTISYGVALTKSLSAFDYAGRAIGLASGGYNNVYAWRQMPVNGGTTDNSFIDGTDTGGIQPTETWWKGIGGFDFVTVPIWKMLDGYPVLTNLPELGSEGNPYRITSRADLDALAVTLSNATDGLAGKYYAVTEDITMTSTEFTPIGTTAKPFKGTFDGNGKTITGLTITGTNDDLGLFGIIDNGGMVKNAVLDSVNVSGNERVGGVVGKVLSGGKVENCRVLSGTIISSQAGGTAAGGVVGLNQGGTVQMSYSAAAVTGIDGVGGVVGRNQGGTVQMSYSVATVTGIYGVGGVVGMNQLNNGQVLNCYAEGNVGVLGSGGQIGGVVGYNLGGTVSKTYYAKGTVQGLESIAGIAGGLNNSGTVTYNVAYSGYVNGTSASHINKIRGYIATTCTESDNYSSTAMTVTNLDGGNAGTTISPDSLKETQDWWQTIVGFNFDTIWQWDNTLKRPILRGVTQ